MSTVTLPKLNQSGNGEWADVEDNDRALRDVVNGELSNINFSASAAIAHTKLATGTAGQIYVANASGAITGIIPTGDVTVTSAGVTNLSADSVGANEIATGSVRVSEIGVLPAVRAFTNSFTPTFFTNTTGIPFDFENYDPAGMHSTTSNTSRLTATAAGRYLFHGAIVVSSGSVAGLLSIRLNGTTTIGAASLSTPSALSTGQGKPVYAQYSLAAGDYVELVDNNSSVGGSTVLTANLAMAWVAP